MQEVRGSNPLSSTRFFRTLALPFKCPTKCLRAHAFPGLLTCVVCSSGLGVAKDAVHDGGATAEGDQSLVQHAPERRRQPGSMSFDPQFIPGMKVSPAVAP